MKFRPLPTIAVAVVLIAVGYFGISTVKDGARSKAFERVTPGTTASDVEAALGVPDLRVPGCRDTPPSWMGAPVASTDCSFHLVYNATFGPRFWTIGFDSENRAIAKYEYVSP